MVKREGRERLAGKLLITPAACLPACQAAPVRRRVLPHWRRRQQPIPFPCTLPPSLRTGRSLARRRDHGSVRRPRRRRVSLRCSHNLWGQSAIRFSLTLLPCCCCCSAASGGAARKNKFKVLSLSLTEQRGRGNGSGSGLSGRRRRNWCAPFCGPIK